jgi:hypothetical protein
MGSWFDIALTLFFLTASERCPPSFLDAHGCYLKKPTVLFSGKVRISANWFSVISRVDVEVRSWSYSEMAEDHETGI